MHEVNRPTKHSRAQVVQPDASDRMIDVALQSIDPIAANADGAEVLHAVPFTASDVEHRLHMESLDEIRPERRVVGLGIAPDDVSAEIRIAWVVPVLDPTHRARWRTNCASA